MDTSMYKDDHITVRELIAILQKFNPDLEVYLCDEEFPTWRFPYLDIEEQGAGTMLYIGRDSEDQGYGKV
jgi:hypothetical protein